jgi:hypothetical protein
MERETDPKTVELELFKCIGRFMSNTMIGIYKMLEDSGISIADSANNQVKVMFLTQYLNKCWATMASGQTDSLAGQYVKRTILEEMRNYLPFESPRCLMHLFYKIGVYVIENMNIVTLGGQTSGTLATECARIAYIYFEDRGVHKCTCAPWEQLSSQSPGPIWELKPVHPEPSPST